MDHAAYVAAIARESAAFEAVARNVALTTRIPTCPEWDLAELVRHCGAAQAWGRATVASRSMTPVSRGDWMERPESDDVVADWFAAGAAALTQVLADAGPEQPVWTWGPSATSGFWARRMAHETAVHRWDAEAAVGEPAPIERELAVDGVDEYVALAPVLRGERLTGEGEVLHFACTDADAMWTIRLTPDGLEAARGGESGDVIVRGTASDVELAFVGRPHGASIDVRGDASVLERWQRVAAF